MKIQWKFNDIYIGNKKKSLDKSRLFLYIDISNNYYYDLLGMENYFEDFKV